MTIGETQSLVSTLNMIPASNILLIFSFTLAEVILVHPVQSPPYRLGSWYKGYAMYTQFQWYPLQVLVFQKYPKGCRLQYGIPVIPYEYHLRVLVLA